MKIKFTGEIAKKLYPSFAPAKKGDAGVDLRTMVYVCLEPGQAKTVPSGVCIAIPEGVVGMLCPRSGLASKSHVSILGAPGIIDSGYRGEIFVTLVNQDLKEPVVFNPGDRIAQLLLVSHVMHETSFEVVEELDETERGIDGLGSSGVK